MFEFIGIILQYGGVILGTATLSFLFLQVALNIFNRTNTPSRVFLRIICFFAWLGIISVSVWALADDYTVPALICVILGYTVGTIFTFYMKKGIKEEERRKQQEQDKEESN